MCLEFLGYSQRQVCQDGDQEEDGDAKGDVKLLKDQSDTEETEDMPEDIDTGMPIGDFYAKCILCALSQEEMTFRRVGMPDL